MEGSVKDLSESQKAERNEVPNVCSGSHPMQITMLVCINNIILEMYKCVLAFFCYICNIVNY